MLLTAVKQLRRSDALTNIASAVIRALGRGIWGLSIPVILSVSDYSKYSIITATAAILAQFAVLGIPQTILRNPKRTLPIFGFTVHAVVLLVIGTILYIKLTEEHEARSTFIIVLMAVVIMAYIIASATAKSRFLFSVVLRAETIGSAFLLIVGLILLIYTRSPQCLSGCIQYNLILIIEVSATVLILALLFWGCKIISLTDMGLSGIKVYFPAIYSIGALVILDLIIWRRVEIYFLQAGPDGVIGVAVFSLAAQISNLFMLIPGSAIEAWYPKLAGTFKQDYSLYQKIIIAKTLSYTKLYTLFIIICLIASIILLQVAFSKYHEWQPYIVTFILLRLIFGYAGFYSSVLYATRREKWLYIPVVAGACIALISNSALTLHYGLSGALISYLITHSFVAISTLLIYRWTHNRLPLR